MNIFSRMSAGWNLGKQSLRVVWNDKTLLVFPLFSGSATLAALAGFYFGMGPEEFERVLNAAKSEGGAVEAGPLIFILAVAVYFVLAFITIFFNVALIGCARISMEERDSKLMDGLRIAMAHLPSIAIWSLISASVGLLISSLENDRRAGQFVRALVGSLWSMITYFVIPVMIFEQAHAFAAIKRSGKLMMRTWGENVGAQFGLGFLLFLAILPAIALIVLGATVGPAALLIPIAVLYIAFATLLQQTAKSVLTVVLYRYAENGTVVGGFDDSRIQHAFARK